jgi:L-asparaginase
LDAFDAGGWQPSDAAAPALSPVLSSAWWPSLGHARPHLLSMTALPWVAMVCSHADADGRLVAAVLAGAERPEGWVLACTGHGTVHEALRAPLLRAEQGGAVVWRSTRVARGGVGPQASGALAVAGVLTPAQARVLMSLGLALGGSAMAEVLREQVLQSTSPSGLMA